MFRLNAREVCHLGLQFVKHKHHRQGFDTLVMMFRKYYRVHPKVLSKQWRDLCSGDDNHNDGDIMAARVPAKEQNEKGFKMFMMCHYFLFVYPKNAQVLAKDFGFGSADSVTGEKFWRWMKRIQALQASKIVWPEEEYMDRNGNKFTITLDCVDFHTREPKHPTLNLDKGFSSHKFKKAAFRYELGLDVHSPRLVWINGPFKAGTYSDKKIFKGGLKDKLKPLRKRGKKAIADGGYEGYENLLSMPSSMDKPHVRRFKSRARCRHEAFNAEIKKYGSMSTYWKHGMEKHSIALSVICITLQYSMELGFPLWDV